eukprot:scaffold5313_cov41-Attheya_sp.AAC.1
MEHTHKNGVAVAVAVAVRMTSSSLSSTTRLAGKRIAKIRLPCASRTIPVELAREDHEITQMKAITTLILPTRLSRVKTRHVSSTYFAGLVFDRQIRTEKNEASVFPPKLVPSRARMRMSSPRGYWVSPGVKREQNDGRDDEDA